MHNISYDKEILLDWIISNETSFLEYLLRYLDYTELYGLPSPKINHQQNLFNESYQNNNEEMADDEILKEKMYYRYRDTNLKINGKKRIMPKESQEKGKDKEESQDIDIQNLSTQLKYITVITERPSKKTIDLLYQLHDTIDKLSKHNLIPFSPKPLLRKLNIYYQRFSYLS